MRPNVLSLLVLSCLFVAACGGNESDSTSTVLTPTTTNLTFSPSTGPMNSGRGIGEAMNLDSYTAAWGSGDPDQIRAFYTEDAVILPLHVMGSPTEGYSPEVWEVAGPDIDREASEHDGGTLEVFDPVRLGNIATFTYRFVVGDIVITGAVIQHYRGDLIWREFLDAEVS